MPKLGGTAYDLIGPENGPVIVLIHGVGLCRKLWLPHIKTLTKKYRVLNYDLFGHGQSEPAPETLSLSVYATQLVDLMDVLNIPKAAIIGFSIGGMINRRFAIDYPERTSVLAVLNSPHDRGIIAQVAVEARAAKVRDQGVLSTMDAAVARWFTPDFIKTNPHDVQSVIDWRQDVDAESYAQAYWVLAAGVTELTMPSIQIDHQALVLTCENDTGSTPDMSHEIAKQMPNSETLIVPRLQHLGLMENPDHFADHIMQFLSQHDL